VDTATSGTATADAVAAVEAPGGGRPSARDVARVALTSQLTGPLAALIVAILVFSVTTSTFWNTANFSLILQQSEVIGMLALGQTLIILTAGIDLANGAIMVLGTVVIARYAVHGSALVGLMIGLVVCMAAGALSGGLVARWKLPPFIVTLGLLTVLAAGARLYTASQSYPVTSSLLTWLGQGPTIGGTTITYGVMLWLAASCAVGYALTQTAWGVRVYAVGDNESAARLTGVKVQRVLFSVYVVAAMIYAIAAWEALGRTPSADPSAYQSANLDSITAVVIGGTSLFGGRGGVAGTLVGVLIVTVLQNGLTQAGIDSLYQQVATGALVIAAVAVDQLVRRRRRT
jgi:fructose transport system permease protein